MASLRTEWTRMSPQFLAEMLDRIAEVRRRAAEEGWTEQVERNIVAVVLEHYLPPR